MRGYEIRHGHSTPVPGQTCARAVLPCGLGWRNAGGNVLGIYLHGMFEDARVLQALFGTAAPTLDSVFDGLADLVDAHLAPSVLLDLVRRPIHSPTP